MGITLQLKRLHIKQTMKLLVIFISLLAKETFCQEERISVDTRAPSTFQNCNCQCDSDTWTDGQYIRGNCRSKDRNGALFCYVSGSALCSCRDVQISSFLKNNQGRFKYYSYEACTTPPRNQCRNSGYNSNLGDGDFPYCSSGGFGGGFGGSGSYRPSGGISSSSGYRPSVVHPSVTAPVVAHPLVTVPAVVPHTDLVEVHLSVTDPGEALFSDPVEVQAIILQGITNLL